MLNLWTCQTTVSINKSILLISFSEKPWRNSFQLWKRVRSDPTCLFWNYLKFTTKISEVSLMIIFPHLHFPSSHESVGPDRSSMHLQYWSNYVDRKNINANIPVELSCHPLRLIGVCPQKTLGSRQGSAEFKKWMKWSTTQTQSKDPIVNRKQSTQVFQ